MKTPAPPPDVSPQVKRELDQLQKRLRNIAAQAEVYAREIQSCCDKPSDYCGIDTYTHMLRTSAARAHDIAIHMEALISTRHLR